MKYWVSPTNKSIIREDQNNYSGGVRVVRTTTGKYFLSCCGLAALECFDYQPSFEDWQDKAEWLACLYRELYDKGTVIYTLADGQLERAAHLAMLELGAKEITTFPNKYYGNNMIHIFEFSVRNIAGRFCDRKGNAYADQASAKAEDIIAEQTKTGAGPSGNRGMHSFAGLSNFN